MLKLIKYEFRKTMFSKFILLFLTALAEIAFLLGVFAEWERALQIGVGGLVMCSMIGLFYIGIESLLVFHRDLNTKQSYMLFLTPHNSFEILGAKVLENGLSIFITGIFYLVLGGIDASIGILRIGGVKEFLQVCDQFLKSIHITVNFHFSDALLVVLVILATWLLMVVTGYFAILLSATVFAGKRFSGLISFLLYLLISWGCGWILDRLPELRNGDAQMFLITGGSLVLVAVMYGITGWIMERRLSV